MMIEDIFSLKTGKKCCIHTKVLVGAAPALPGGRLTEAARNKDAAGIGLVPDQRNVFLRGQLGFAPRSARNNSWQQLSANHAATVV
jgi:hypothetical protein